MRFNCIFKNTIAFILSLVCIVSALCVSATGYTYNSYGKTIEVPDIFSPKEKYFGADLKCGQLNNPTDISIDNEGNVFIADKGNNRIVITNKSLNKSLVLSDFVLDGETTSLTNPSGIFAVNKNEIYIADTDNERILKVDSKGKVLKTFLKPEISQFQTDLFLPTSVIADKYGNVYTKCTGIYQGLVMFNAAGEYQSFFGSEKVKPTASIQLQYWWKSIMNDDQKSQISRYVPTEIKGIDIDNSGYIYTVAASETTDGVKNTMDNIRRLNTLGNDILVNKMNTSAWKVFESDARGMNFIDLCVDENNFLTLLDNRQGLIVFMDNQLRVLDVIGGYGDNLGQFLLPNAIDTFENKIFVLDGTDNSITVLQRTSYGEKIKQALVLYKQGHYDETLTAWENVIKDNTNCELAYEGLGNAYLSLKDYDKAISCFEKARNSEGYNEAFKYIRKRYIKKYFTPVVISVFVLVVLVLIIKKRRKGKKNAKV